MTAGVDEWGIGFHSGVPILIVVDQAGILMKEDIGVESEVVAGVAGIGEVGDNVVVHGLEKVVEAEIGLIAISKP